MSGLVGALKKYKYVLLLLCVGLALMLLPSRAVSVSSASDGASDTEARLEEVISAVKGVGETSVLCSEEGVVVVCAGGDSASVRLDVTRAVSVYTGLGADRITVLKMELEG